MRPENYYVYILTNWAGNVMYIGMTNNLERRTAEHKSRSITGFTKSYAVNKLVYFEHTDDVNSAIAREKQLKNWRREKKDALVRSMNPEWKDLSETWLIPTPAIPSEAEGSFQEDPSASLGMTVKEMVNG